LCQASLIKKYNKMVLRATFQGPFRNAATFIMMFPLPPHLFCLLQVHGECETVRTSFRPVPLTWQFCHALPAPQGGNGGAPPAARLLPLLDGTGRSINRALLPPAQRYSGDENSGGRAVGAYLFLALLGFACVASARHSSLT
jgi:hypothetical protein